MTLVHILLATVAGGVLSVLAAAALSYSVLSRWAPRLVSYAVGVLLGAAFLNLLPEAVNELGPEDVLATCLGGVLAFFVLEKLAIWRHSHFEPEGGDPAHAHAAGLAHSHGHGHAHARRRISGPMIVFGDGLHNFVDGVLIAAAFLTDPAIGWGVAIGVIAHEIPQEVGDFMVLLHAGYSRRRALLLNALSGTAAVLGGLLGYFFLSDASEIVPYALAFSAASFIYVAVADLIPELHRRWDLGDAVTQIVLIGTGVATISFMHSLVH